MPNLLNSAPKVYPTLHEAIKVAHESGIPNLNIEKVAENGYIIENPNKVNDMVNHPEHYKAGGIETLDFIKAKLNNMANITPYQAYCLGNAMKYISRADLKGKFEEDIKKAIFYLRSAIGDDPR